VTFITEDLGMNKTEVALDEALHKEQRMFVNTVGLGYNFSQVKGEDHIDNSVGVQAL